MKILLVTPLYPPHIGGPAKYAVHLKEEMRKKGHMVTVVTPGFERSLPATLRYLSLFFRVFFCSIRADAAIILDASSVGIPATLGCALTRTRCVLRIGGDFLWETYVERTKEEVSLMDFYKRGKLHLSLKERVMRSLITGALRRADVIATNTEWFIPVLEAYRVRRNDIVCIENHFDAPHMTAAKEDSFIAVGRPIALKNTDRLIRAFAPVQAAHKSVSLVTGQYSGRDLHLLLEKCRASAVVSFTEVNSNLILEGIALGKPFIVTKETGLHPRFASMGITVDPFDEAAITAAFEVMLSADRYEHCRKAIEGCTYRHTWEEIAEEFLRLCRTH